MRNKLQRIEKLLWKGYELPDRATLWDTANILKQINGGVPETWIKEDIKRRMQNSGRHSIRWSSWCFDFVDLCYEIIEEENDEKRI